MGLPFTNLEIPGHWTTEFLEGFLYWHFSGQRGESVAFAELSSDCPIHFFQGPSSQSLLSNIPEASTSLWPIPGSLTASTQPTTNASIVASLEQPLPPRNWRLPAKYQDLLPEPPLPAIDPQPTTSSSVIPHIFLHVFDSFWTQFNKFGIMCAYRHTIWIHSLMWMSCLNSASQLFLIWQRAVMATTPCCGCGQTCLSGISWHGRRQVAISSPTQKWCGWCMTFFKLQTSTFKTYCHLTHPGTHFR